MDAQGIIDLKANQTTDALVVEMVMGEIKPDYVPENYLDANLSGVEPPQSPKQCWKCYCYYEHGDVPEWEPQPFSQDPRWAYRMEEHLKDQGLNVPYADCLARVLELMGTGKVNRFDLVHATPLQRCQAAIWLTAGLPLK